MTLLRQEGVLERLERCIRPRHPTHLSRLTRVRVVVTYAREAELELPSILPSSGDFLPLHSGIWRMPLPGPQTGPNTVRELLLTRRGVLSIAADTDSDTRWEQHARAVAIELADLGYVLSSRLRDSGATAHPIGAGEFATGSYHARLLNASAGRSNRAPAWRRHTAAVWRPVPRRSRSARRQRRLRALSPACHADVRGERSSSLDPGHTAACSRTTSDFHDGKETDRNRSQGNGFIPNH